MKTGEKAVADQIGARLRWAREQCAMTQREAAAAIGVHRTALMAWESGQRQPRLTEFRELLKLYGVSGNKIMFGYELFDLTSDEARELETASSQFSPELREKAEGVLLAMGRLSAARRVGE